MRLSRCHSHIVAVLLVTFLCQLMATAAVHSPGDGGLETPMIGASSDHHPAHHAEATDSDTAQSALCCDQNCDYQGDCALMHIVMVPAEGDPGMALIWHAGITAAGPSGFPTRAVDLLLRPPISA